MWYGLVRFGCGIVQYSAVWCGMVRVQFRYGAIHCGTVEYDAVHCGHLNSSRFPGAGMHSFVGLALRAGIPTRLFSGYGHVAKALSGNRPESRLMPRDGVGRSRGRCYGMTSVAVAAVSLGVWPQSVKSRLGFLITSAAVAAGSFGGWPQS